MKTIKNLLASCLISIFAIATVQAGELTVSGSMKIANTNTGGVTTGNGFGQDAELALTGSTELDNGITASYKQTVTDAFAFNDSELMFATSYGTIGLSSTGGTVEDIDNIVPTAYEEAEALIKFGSSGFMDVGANDGTYGIVYKNAIPGGMNLTAFYAPKGQTGDAAADDTTSGDVNSKFGKAYSVYLRGNPLNLIEGVDFALGYENTEKTAKNASTKEAANDEASYTAALNYAIGPVKIGTQIGWLDTGNTLSTETEGYLNRYVGVAFAVNENLSVSYQNTTSKKRTNIGNNVETDIDGYSIAYTMGGMTVAIVRNDASNADYTTNKKRTGNQIALALAF